MSENPEQYKDRILTKLFRTKIIHDKVEGIVGRHVHKNTFIFEDVLQETFYWLCKYPTDKFIEIMKRNPDKLIGFAVRIAVLKGVTSNSVQPEYPNHSVLKQILFASNLNQFKHLSSTENVDTDTDDWNIVLVDNTTIESNEDVIWNVIRENLTSNELQFLDKWLNKEKKVGRLKQSELDNYNNLLDRIREILIKNDYKISTHD